MRRRAVLWGACLAVALAALPAATPQEPRPADGVPTFHWPHRTVGIHVNADKLASLPKDRQPSELQLFHAASRGRFQKGPRLAVNALQALDAGKKGFLFTADRDGEYEFCIQFVYPDGAVSPAEDEVGPQQRIVIDTTPPAVRVLATGNGVRWEAADDHLDPRYVELQCKWPSSTEWTPITDRRQFRPADSYAWKLQPNQVLEVRVKARDRAGNEGFSPVVRVPGDAAVGAAFPRVPSGSGPEWLPPSGAGAAAGGPPAGNLPQPRIEYVSTKDITIDYKIQRAGRSKVQAAHLFVLRDQGGWQPVKRFPIDPPADQGQTLSLKYEADKEGTYGFYVIPESGAGQRADDPRRDDQPMVYAVVDWSKPHVKITGVEVRPGPGSGPLVDITWEVTDANLMPRPISLEYSLDRKAVQWREVKFQLEPGQAQNDRFAGRFTWEVTDKDLWRFWVRIRATDKAANTGEQVWDKEVIVDLEKPAAGINRVRGGATPGEDPPATTPLPARSPDPSRPGSPPGGPAMPPLPAEAPEKMP